MKEKISIIFLFFVCISMHAQFNIGGSIGFPTGNFNEGYDVAFSAEANYLFDITDHLKAGPTIAYDHFVGGAINAVEVVDAAFLPLALTSKYSISDEFILGFDLGYAVGLEPGNNDGGFYYRPLLGYQLSQKWQLTASYSSVSVYSSAFAKFGFGFMFRL